MSVTSHLAIFALLLVLSEACTNTYPSVCVDTISKNTGTGVAFTDPIFGTNIAASGTLTAGNTNLTSLTIGNGTTVLDRYERGNAQISLSANTFLTAALNITATYTIIGKMVVLTTPKMQGICNSYGFFQGVWSGPAILPYQAAYTMSYITLVGSGYYFLPVQVQIVSTGFVQWNMGYVSTTPTCSGGLGIIGSITMIWHLP